MSKNRKKIENHEKKQIFEKSKILIFDFSEIFENFRIDFFGTPQSLEKTTEVAFCPAGQILVFGRGLLHIVFEVITKSYE